MDLKRLSINNTMISFKAQQRHNVHQHRKLCVVNLSFKFAGDNTHASDNSPEFTHFIQKKSIVDRNGRPNPRREFNTAHRCEELLPMMFPVAVTDSRSAILYVLTLVKFVTGFFSAPHLEDRKIIESLDEALLPNMQCAVACRRSRLPLCLDGSTPQCFRLERTQSKNHSKLVRLKRQLRESLARGLLT